VAVLDRTSLKENLKYQFLLPRTGLVYKIRQSREVVCANVLYIDELVHAVKVLFCQNESKWPNLDSLTLHPRGLIHHERGFWKVL
jgi:hypothetical protein